MGSPSSAGARAAGPRGSAEARRQARFYVNSASASAFPSTVASIGAASRKTAPRGARVPQQQLWALASAEIDVETFKGIVQRSGFVGSQAAADRAQEAARGVSSVTAVKNDMQNK
jgi:hypothetical protein